MTALRALAIATALAMSGLASAGCNAITGLDRNYVEVDCFPPGSCADGSMPDGGASDGASMLDDAVANADALEGTANSQADADARGPDGSVESGAAGDGGPESNTDGAPCTDSCVSGSTQCSLAGVVQTCQRGASGCTQWVAGASCAAHQSCMVAKGLASCACSPSQCTQVGAVCQDGQTLATCAKDASGCYYIASTSTCVTPQSCSGMAPGAACSTTCSNSCTQGQTSCINGGLATCTLGANGCLSYGAPMACGSHQSCTGAAGTASCTCTADPVCTASGSLCANSTTLATCSKDAQNCVYESSTTTCANGACSGGACCTNGCIAGQTSCVTGGLATCAVGANGCLSYTAPAACGAHQSCMGAAGAASCGCKTDSVCTAAGSACADSATLATCSTDAQGCLYESATMTCAAPKSCSGMAPGAGCSLTCTSSCSQGQKSCISGGLATCTLGANGCWSYGTPATCGTHQTCSGTAGAAQCTCTTDLVCGAAGTTCANSTTLATCTTDGQGCVYESATKPCDVCSGNTCCTNSCSPGQTSCVNGGLATCTQGPNGCWSYGTPGSCGAHRSCTGAAGSAQCTCNRDPVCAGGGIGDKCANPTTQATCALDSNNCLYESASRPCTNGACSGTTCCTNACSNGDTKCTSPTGGQACSIGSNGCYQWGAMACSASICSNGACVNPPSCQGGVAGMMNCGPNESCCTSVEVPGGTYTRQGGQTATVTAYRLDKYLVTVGRFRQFVNAVIGGYLPPAGSGKHKHLNGGSGLVDSGSGTPPTALETGWVTADNVNIAPNGNLGCNGSFSTWTNASGNQENLPITCENWFEARAFCIWDGGFLPSESEWEFAGVGGGQQRAYPWGSTDPGTLNQYAIYSCYFGGGAGPNTCTGTANIAPVGSVPLGAGLWGHLDMAGDAAEWTLDLTALPPTTCTDCAYLTGGDFYRAIHGGAYNDDAMHLNPLNGVAFPPTSRLESTTPGFRCARIP